MSAVGHLNHAGDFLKQAKNGHSGSMGTRSEVQRARVSGREETDFAHGPLQKNDHGPLPLLRAVPVRHPSPSPPPSPIPRPLPTDLFVLVGQHDGVIRLRVERVLDEHLEQVDVVVAAHSG